MHSKELRGEAPKYLWKLCLQKTSTPPKNWVSLFKRGLPSLNYRSEEKDPTKSINPMFWWNMVHGGRGLKSGLFKYAYFMGECYLFHFRTRSKSYAKLNIELFVAITSRFQLLVINNCHLYLIFQCSKSSTSRSSIRFACEITNKFTAVSNWSNG